MSKGKNRGIRDIREFRKHREVSNALKDSVFSPRYKNEEKKLIRHCDKIVITHQDKTRTSKDRGQDPIPYEKIKAFREAFNAEFDIKPRIKVRRKIYWNQLLRISAVVLLFINIAIVFFYGKNDRNSGFAPYQISSLDLSGTSVNSDFKLEKGLDFYDQGKYLQAIDLLEEVPPSHAKAEMVSFLMGNAFMALEDYQVAIVYFKKVLQNEEWTEYRDESREYLNMAYAHLNIDPD